MSVFRSRPALRWLIPSASAVLVIAGGAVIGTFAASAEPSLPPRSAAQLLVDLQTARLDGLSGTVVQRADLGLPGLSALATRGSTDLTSLASGTHTLRVWYAGPDQTRVALLGTLGESDIIRNGRDLWWWNSQTNTATHRTLPETGDAGQSRPHSLPATPQEAADQALAAIDPSTEVTVGRSAKIAGRDAYELVLDPRDTASLVDQIRIAIDAREHVPLRFEIFAKGADQPAFVMAFTQVDFDRPDPAQFTFNPPPGTQVTEQEFDQPQRPDHGTDRSEARWETTGTGWTTVLVGRNAKVVPSNGGDTAGLLNLLPKVDGAWGSGRLLSSRLFSVLLTDDGRLLVGAVTPERLYEVAAAHR
ncbi:outer membrane lipoprotein carrier protein LolA [Micromonospora sonneratiae]|uniref:Outer membrane lipoprotein carrier protein LolA n=1 Tax=Micromonospora sonneratiae TaxID=1184706 RepID=A0ABW3Y9A2_9ACTN